MPTLFLSLEEFYEELSSLSEGVRELFLPKRLLEEVLSGFSRITGTEVSMRERSRDGASLMKLQRADVWMKSRGVEIYEIEIRSGRSFSSSKSQIWWSFPSYSFDDIQAAAQILRSVHRRVSSVPSSETYVVLFRPREGIDLLMDIILSPRAVWKVPDSLWTSRLVRISQILIEQGSFGPAFATSFVAYLLRKHRKAVFQWYPSFLPQGPHSSLEELWKGLNKGPEAIASPEVWSGSYWLILLLDSFWALGVSPSMDPNFEREVFLFVPTVEVRVTNS